MIELWDGYCISADEYQYVLGKPTLRTHKARNTDELHMNNATYHLSLAQALATFHRMQLRESIRSNDQSLAQAVAVSAQIENRIRDLVPEPVFTVRT